jgi:hypothetical protein
MPMSSHMPGVVPRLRPLPPAQREQGGYQRERVTPRQLVDAINRELRRRPCCGKLSVTGRGWRTVDGGDACNWSPAALIVYVDGAMPAEAFTVLREVVTHAQDCFDLELALERAA